MKNPYSFPLITWWSEATRSKAFCPRMQHRAWTHNLNAIQLFFFFLSFFLFFCVAWQTISCRVWCLFRRNLYHDRMYVVTIDIHRRSHTSYTAPCNGVVSHGAQNWGSSSFFDDHTCNNTCKTNAPTIFAHHAAFYACLSSCLDHGRCRWHTYLTNHGYFDYGKTPKTPNLSPMPE